MSLQAAKDSFYMALKERLAALNPARLVTVAGEVRPAVLVAENEPLTAAGRAQHAFYLEWGAASAADGLPAGTVMRMECAVHYAGAGTEELQRQDRGRVLGALDGELLTILSPNTAPLRDYTQTPARALGSEIFWSAAQLGEAEASGAEVKRVVRVTVYFFPEES